jgi:ABC-type multidrug transport system ATPase subunit
VDLTLRAGEIVLLLGPNGAGKTTLLRTLSTLLPWTRGEIIAEVEYDGAVHRLSLGDLASWGRDFVGLVSHASLVYDNLTGAENLALFGALYGLSEEEAKARAGRLLEQLELTDAADRQVVLYSRGMRQRLSVARAVLQDPSLVLLDEPFTGLDPSGVRIVCEMLERLRSEGKVIVLITHHLALPPEVVDRAVMLRRGVVVRDERPAGTPLGRWYEEALS